ncbi:MAG: GGDEF domain-containing protein [Bacilli bacterium]|nr:GGDEF domain-containing protein [Bacilli bacterium]
MNFQELINTYAIPACVVSVEKLGEDKYGEIRIIAGNPGYLRDNHLPDDVVFGDLYDKYAPNDKNFEFFAFRCAVKKENLHAYVHPDRWDIWLDCNWIPLSMNDGNIYYMVYAMEMSSKMDESKLINRDADVTSDVLKTCIKLHKGDDLEKTMREVIVDIKELCAPKFCRLLIRDNKTKECSIISELGQDQKFECELMDVMESDLYSISEKWIKDIAGSNCFIAKNADDMLTLKERDPAWYRSLVKFGVESLILFPVEYGREVIGFIWVTNFDAEKTAKIKDTLELISYFIASYIYSNQLLQRLEVMSTTDMLTGLLNRAAMDRRIEELSSKKSEALMSIGVYFADVNGLKVTNDTYGHEAGDRLLNDAANLLREVFCGYEIYRVGGDEFMVICPNMDQRTFGLKLQRIRELQKKRGNIILAIGGKYSTDTNNLLDDMKEADNRMYESKKLFYESQVSKTLN